jgi:hypothetical protein
MNKLQFSLVASASCLLLLNSVSGAETFQEDFSGAPSGHGWRASGNTALFNWNATGQNLQVTWDSAQTNSYFYRPLGTVLTKADDFTLEFDLRLLDIATGSKPGPFEIAVGFLNLADALRTNFWRGTGVNADHGPRNILEFDYFPSGYYPDFGSVGASVSPSIISTDNGFAAGFAVLELATNDIFHVSLNYSASSQTLHTAITRNGTPFANIGDVTLLPDFTDFQLDTVAVSSYSDFGDDFDSVLAHAIVDNLTVTTPPLPVQNMTGHWKDGVWEVDFVSATNWAYILERSDDLQSWRATSSVVSGTGGNLSLQDTNAPMANAYYRVGARKQ